MKVMKIKDYDIKPPKKKAFTIETPEEQIKLHTLMAVIGKRGSGKSVCVSNLIQKLIQQNIIDRVLLMSPTANSNREIWEPLNIQEEDIFYPTKKNLYQIEELMNQEATEWETFQSKKKAYKKYEAFLRSNVPIEQIDPELLLEVMDANLLEGPPKWKYRNEKPPVIILIVDDSVGTEIYQQSSPLTRLCMSHRHLGAISPETQALGLSIIFCCQTYRSTTSLPRPIRENATHLLLFKNKDENQVKAIHEEIGQDIDLDTFNNFYQYATKEPHSFLMVDFHPKAKFMTFRKNFDEILYE